MKNENKTKRCDSNQTIINQKFGEDNETLLQSDRGLKCTQHTAATIQQNVCCCHTFSATRTEQEGKKCREIPWKFILSPGHITRCSSPITEQQTIRVIMVMIVASDPCAYCVDLLFAGMKKVTNSSSFVTLRKAISFWSVEKVATFEKNCII